MRYVLGILLVALPASAGPEKSKLDVAVLYAGVKESPRTAEWVAFLSGTFREVRTVELAKLSMETAGGADVVIVDSPSPYQPDGKFQMPKTPRLDLGFTKPVILMGAAGGSVVSPLRIKINWL